MKKIGKKGILAIKEKHSTERGGVIYSSYSSRSINSPVELCGLCREQANVTRSWNVQLNFKSIIQACTHPSSSHAFLSRLLWMTGKLWYVRVCVRVAAHMKILKAEVSRYRWWYCSLDWCHSSASARESMTWLPVRIKLTAAGESEVQPGSDWRRVDG